MPSCITPVPNIVLDHYLKELKSAELKVLLIVIRQTLGWKDRNTKSTRKDIDWIASNQLALKTGSSKRAINDAIQSLVQKKLIEVFSFSGEYLDVPEKRRGQQKLFFRLSSAISADADNMRISAEEGLDKKFTNANFAGDLRKKMHELAQKMRMTKETLQN